MEIFKLFLLSLFAWIWKESIVLIVIVGKSVCDSPAIEIVVSLAPPSEYTILRTDAHFLFLTSKCNCKSVYEGDCDLCLDSS